MWPSRTPLSVLIACLITAAHQTPSALQSSEWTLDSARPSAYVLEATGRATDANGATVAVRSTADTSGVFAAVVSRLPVDAVRGRRATLSGDLQTRAVTGGASLWLRIDHGTTALMLDNGSDQIVRGDAEWTRRSISLPVPEEATVIALGVLLRGGGAVNVRNLRIEVSAPFDVSAPLAAPAKEVLDAAVSIAKKNSLRRNEVEWNVVEPKVRALAAGAEKSADVYPAIRYLLAQLGDRHSFLMPPAQTRQFQTGGAQNPVPEVRALPERVGYISVPGYGGAEPAASRAYASRMHEALAGTMASVSCGWVVDLRPNTGGNMWPMLAGLKPFLGSGGLGTFESPAGSSPPWIAGHAIGVEPPAMLSVLESAWIAVLTGPKTASSGEAVAIAFRGRPRTRSFGLPTAGLSTANQSFPLPDGAMIFLTMAVDADRAGRLYGDKIDPDERVDAEAPGDSALSVAIRWLKQSAGCAEGGSRQRMTLDRVLSIYRGGDPGVVARTFAQPRDFHDGLRDLERWLGPFDPSKAVLLLEIAKASGSVAPQYPAIVVRAGRSYVTEARDRAVASGGTSGFAELWNRVAAALLQDLGAPSLVEEHVAFLERDTKRQPEAGSIDARLLLARAIAQERRCWDSRPSLEHMDPASEALARTADVPINAPPSSPTRSARAADVEEHGACLREAVARFEASAAIAETRAEARVRGGWVLFQAGRLPEALASLEAVVVEGDSELAYWADLFRGRVLGRLGRPEEAARAYQGALATFPASQSAGVGYTLELIRADRIVEADKFARWLRTATATADDPWSNYHRGDWRFLERWLTQLRTAVR